MLIVLFAAALAQADPAPAQAASAAPAPAAAKPAKSKLVCRSNLVTGSRLGAERICKTQEEWDNITRDSRDRLEDQTRHGLQITLPPNTTNG